MTIEYKYPMRPKSARIETAGGPVLFMSVSEEDRGDDVYIETPFVVVHEDAVPEVCEAMMRLAGHEWPGVSLSAAVEIERQVQKVSAERIIARLEKEQVSHSSYKYGLEHAARVIREECGL